MTTTEFHFLSVVSNILWIHSTHTDRNSQTGCVGPAEDKRQVPNRTKLQWELVEFAHFADEASVLMKTDCSHLFLETSSVTRFHPVRRVGEVDERGSQE